MRRFLAGLSLTLALTAPLAADPGPPQVFVRNAPFPAEVNGQGTTVVQYEAFARALGYQLHTRGDVLEILAPGDEPCPAAHPAGLYFNHEPIEADVAAGTAPLEPLAARLGARVVHNAGTGTVDIYPDKPHSKKSSGASQANFHALVFTNGEPAPSQLTRVAPSLGQRFGLEVNAVDIKGPEYERYRRYRQTGALPLTVLLDGAGRILGQWTGIPDTARIEQLCQQRVNERQGINGQRVAGRSGGRASFSGVGGGGGGG